MTVIYILKDSNSKNTFYITNSTIIESLEIIDSINLSNEQTPKQFISYVQAYLMKEGKPLIPFMKNVFILSIPYKLLSQTITYAVNKINRTEDILSISKLFHGINSSYNVKRCSIIRCGSPF